MQERRLQNWVTSLESSILFISGNHDSYTSTLQPTSFISARLAEQLAEIDPTENSIISLPFFFGLHGKPSNPAHGIEAAVHSLITQLLGSYADFPMVALKRARRELNDPDMDTLECSLRCLKTLLASLPASYFVYFILDSLTQYEALARHKSDLEYFAQALSRIVKHHREKRECVIKVLMMGPWNSTWLHKTVKEEDEEAEFIWMPSKVSVVGGFSALKWEASVGDKSPAGLDDDEEEEEEKEEEESDDGW